MGLIKLIVSFCLIWIGIIFVVLGLNSFRTFGLPIGSFTFYLGTASVFSGMFLLVIGVCYVMNEFR